MHINDTTNVNEIKKKKKKKKANFNIKIILFVKKLPKFWIKIIYGINFEGPVDIGI
jgi:hypothetical protein